VETAAPELSNAAAFWWGCLGGLAALAVSQVLPLAIEVAKSGAGWTLTRWRVAAAIVVVLVFVLIGGVAALMAGNATSAGQAIIFGIGSQATVAGVFKTSKALSS
jgi:hypothetical protein